jgi:deoxyribodipyrimidine photo-lyase
MTHMPAPIIVWLRRDLRVRDNTALLEASERADGSVIPVFVLDDALLRGRDVSTARVAFMLDSLRALAEALARRSSRLILRRGETIAELLDVARESGATALFANKDYTPLARARDQKIDNALTEAGVAVTWFKDQVHFEEAEILTGARNPYTVFTPYKRAWLARPRPAARDAALRLTAPPPAVRSHDRPDLAALGMTLDQRAPAGGEAEAERLLAKFIANGIADYDSARDQLAAPGTSRLSPHLRFGTISPRVCVQAAEAARRSARRTTGHDVWISELIWREFYQQVLFNFPHADRGSFKRDYDALRWGSGSADRDAELFDAWKAGRTGFPVVDAAMRQLNTEAWMHNRARMIVASFFTKDLHLNWRLGEAYFMQRLVDGDPAANNGGWQWAASTGTDAQPYFRVFNPRLQGERYDADGAYVRAFVPELARVPAKAIHAPESLTPLEARALNFEPGVSYPRPIVEHATQKDEIIRRFKSLRAA